jgi:hypothetical protein
VVRYTVDEKMAAEAKEQNMEWLHQFCWEEGMAWPEKIDLNKNSEIRGYAKSGIGVNGKLPSNLSNQSTVGTHLYHENLLRFQLSLKVWEFLSKIQTVMDFFTCPRMTSNYKLLELFFPWLLLTVKNSEHPNDVSLRDRYTFSSFK